jgi:hypothetical protein
MSAAIAEDEVLVAKAAAVYTAIEDPESGQLLHDGDAAGYAECASAAWRSLTEPPR